MLSTSSSPLPLTEGRTVDAVDAEAMLDTELVSSMVSYFGKRKDLEKCTYLTFFDYFFSKNKKKHLTILFTAAAAAVLFPAGSIWTTTGAVRLRVLLS